MGVYKLEESEQEVTVLVGVRIRGTTLGVRILNLEKESCEHFKWTHLEQVQHCTDLPIQVTFPVHTEQGKTGLGLE